jgi:hypothetical protein
VKFRSKEVFEAVQWGGPGSPTPPGACEGIPHPAGFHSCDTFRNGVHVHGSITGRLEFLKPGDWVSPLGNDLFRVIPDSDMQAAYEPVFDIDAALASTNYGNDFGPVSGLIRPVRRKRKEAEEPTSSVSESSGFMSSLVVSAPPPRTPSESLKEIDRILAEEKAPNQE